MFWGACPISRGGFIELIILFFIIRHKRRKRFTDAFVHKRKRGMSFQFLVECRVMLLGIEQVFFNEEIELVECFGITHKF